MITLGIDLSSQPKDTAACLVEWHADGRIIAREPSLHCTDATLDKLVARADAAGIDAPLGWPAAFTQAVARWTATAWDDPAFQKNLRLRVTDIEAHRRTRLTPLSVSTDRIALPAMRAMALLARHGATDRGGDGKFFEVYPAGSLHQWGLPSRRYKGAGNRAARQKLLAGLRLKLPSLQVAPAAFWETDHALDALIAALTARCAATGRTLACPDALRAVARHEGWIHLPQAGVFPAWPAIRPTKQPPI